MKRTVVLFNLLLISSIVLFAQKAEIFSTADGAIRGYDAVGYFKLGKAIKGSSENVYLWKDAKWYFSSKENLVLFKTNPERYAPQYGGYCAYGLSEGHKASTNPDAFTIVNDKLYLNYNLNVRESWSQNWQERIISADKKWPVIKNEE